jgi:hypothetical protein
MAEAALAVEVREVADLPEAVSRPVDQEWASTGSGPDFPGISEIFGAIGFTIVISIMMTSSFSVTRSFIPSTTGIILTDIRTGTILTALILTATDTIRTVNRAIRVHRLRKYSAV